MQMLSHFDFSQRGPAVLLLVLLVAVELLWLRRQGRDWDWRESLASTAVALGNRLIRPLTALLLAPLFLYVHERRLLEIDIDSAWGFVALLLLVDFIYYWFHRASHRIAWLWATHGVHHSTTRFNLSAAYRLGWTDLLSGSWLFLLALVWLGLPAAAVLAAFSLNLLYQFFLHTEAVGRLGPLEWLFNTPSHHRVHHARNAALIDRNFGGVLIVWDRLFGSFAEAPADEALKYGLSDGDRGHHPLRIVFGGWLDLHKQLRRTAGWRARLRLLFLPQ